jgi:hypothetical protein
MNQSVRGAPTPAERARIMVYRGKKIFKIDFANCRLPEIQQIMAAARKIIHLQPPKSVLIFTDLTNTELNADVITEMNVFAADNASFAKASAVTGVVGSRQMVLDAVNKSTSRTIRSFPNPIAAQNWLVSQ